MAKIMGLVSELVIGIERCYFGAPFPDPPGLMEALGALSITIGYAGTDVLLTWQAQKVGSAVQPPPTAPYCAGPFRLRPSPEPVTPGQNTGHRMKAPAPTVWRRRRLPETAPIRWC